MDWSRVEEDKCYADFVEERDWNQSFHAPQEKFRTFRQTWFLNHQHGKEPKPWRVSFLSVHAHRLLIRQLSDDSAHEIVRFWAWKRSENMLQ